MSEGELSELIAQHRDGVVVDANLLLLYLVGECNSSWIKQFKRTASFGIEDYRVLSRLLKRFNRILTTPNILTEVNGMANQLQKKRKEAFAKLMTARIAQMNEEFVESRTASTREEFAEFGLTDSAIVCVGETDSLVITDDLPLYHLMSGLELPCINFNHIRSLES